MPFSPDRRRRSFSPRRERERDHERARERDRERERREMDRRRGRDRERDRDERDRHRDDRDRERRRVRSRSRSRERPRGSSDRSRDRDIDAYQRPRHNRYERERLEPTSILIVKGLKPDTLEDTISQAMEKRGSGPLKDVRIVRDKMTGVSRGFAFVEFLTTREASRFIDICCDDTLFIDDVPMALEFSRKREEGSTEWICIRCDAPNPRWREACSVCHRKKPSLPSLDEVDPPMDGAAESGSSPSNVLIFRGLDALSTELTVTEAVRAHTALPIKDVRLIKDRLTNTSRGFCFVELNSIAEANQLLESLQYLDPPFAIDGRSIIIGFARQPQVNPAQAKSGAAAIQAAQWSSGPKASGMGASTAAPTSTVSTATAATAVVSAAPAIAGKIIPPTDAQKAFEAGYLAAQQQVTATLAATAATAATAAATQLTQPTVIQQAPAIEIGPKMPEQTKASQAVEAAQALSQPIIGPTPAPSAAVPATAAGAPDTGMGSTYTYDAASGYYYDSSTGLYYDPSTQYHYNPTTQQYCYYDTQKQQYVPVANNNTGNNGGQNAGPDDKKDKKKKKDGGAASARKIARDMERWAKSLNAAKDATKAALAAAEAAKAVQAASQQVSILRSVEQAPLSLESLQAARQVEARFEQGSKNVVSGTFLGQEAPSEPLNFDGKNKKNAESVVDDWKTKMNAMAAEKKREATPPPVPVPVREEPSFAIPDGADPDPGHTDWKQMACLLCKRRFPNPNALVRHQQLSSLHKNNLAAKGRPPLPVTVQVPADQQAAAGPTAAAPAPAPRDEPMLRPSAAGRGRDSFADNNMMYRDRAAARRSLHGPAEAPQREEPRQQPLPYGFGGELPSVAASQRSPPRQRRPAREESYEQPGRGGLGTGNVGNRMMQAMGWSEGEGLGRHAQGRIDAVQAQTRAGQAGLGSRGSDYGAYVSDSRRETMTRLTQARFRENDY
ncbi:RNA-binding protein 5-like isoform X2 [Sycon ciliatum]|uniref:RNA-binding protein 5-like isoform X2 n=1 Tax=Sycon ciliatum TaxID=27933 RepID=UPI0031F66BC8